MISTVSSRTRLLACTCLSILVLAFGMASGCGDPAQDRFRAGLRSFVHVYAGRVIHANLWYPAPQNLQEKELVLNTIYTARGVRDAPLSTTPAQLPLLVLSHGSGGGRADLSWLASRLARRGYVILAVEHPGNRFGDDSPEGVVAVWRRPPDLSAGIDAMLNDPQFGPRIDASRVGAAGHSSGGYSVIALAGAIYDFGRMDTYCSGPQRGPDCDLVDDLDFSLLPDLARSGDSYRDPRVRAVFALAPAVGQGFEREQLEAIEIPVHIVGALDDALTLFETNAAHYARHIPEAELEIVERGGHFVFLSTCNENGRSLAPQVCTDEDPETDRAVVHDRLAESAHRFFYDRFR